LTLGLGSNRGNWRLMCCGQSSRDYDVMTVVLDSRNDTEGEGRAVPIRAVAVTHNQFLAPPNDRGEFSATEHDRQGETAIKAEKRLAELNKARSAASLLLFEALGYPVVDRQLRLRPPRLPPEVMPACVGALIELSEILPL
jgi:hypothetical protein